MIIKIAKIINSTKLIPIWQIWLKFTKIVKSMSIHSVWWNFVKSAIFVAACISGHKWENDMIWLMVYLTFWISLDIWPTAMVIGSKSERKNM